MRSHQESAGDREGNDAHYDEEERGDPLGGQPRRNAGPVPSVDGLTLPDQADCEGTCRDKMALVSVPRAEPRSNVARKQKRGCLFQTGPRRSQRPKGRRLHPSGRGSEDPIRVPMSAASSWPCERSHPSTPSLNPVIFRLKQDAQPR